MLSKHLANLKPSELFFVLSSILNEDCYVQEFVEDETLQLFLELLEAYDVVYISSDDRVLLTPYGEKFLQNLVQKNVDFAKEPNKVKKEK